MTATLLTALALGRGLVSLSATRARAASGPGDIVVTLKITGNGKAAIGTGISDECKFEFNGRAVFPLDPATGRYGDATDEQYSMTASGSGHILDVETWTYHERQPGPGTISLVFQPSDGRAVVGWPYMDDFIASEPEAGGGAERLARTGIKIAEDDLIMKDDSGVVTFKPNAQSFSANGSVAGTHSDVLGSAEINASYTVTRSGEQVEAVILNPKDYAQWMPVAGPDQTTPGTNPVVVMAELRLKGASGTPPVTRAKFRFELVDTSKEPGLCMNAPSKDEATSDFDLQFTKSKGIEPTNQKQRYETDTFTSSSSAIVLCYDFGAATKVKVTAITESGDEIPAHLDGKPDVKWLTLPQDDNGNRLADSWEKSEEIWGKISAPAWDEADEPNDHETNGDGISLYEKYRGFKFGGEHERLIPRVQYVFIYDPDELVHLNLGSVMDFQLASKLRVRFVVGDEWTGPGTAGSKKRIVNFNTSGFGHAVDQHGLHVRLVNSATPTLAQDFQKMWTAKYGSPLNKNISSYYGFTYHDVTGGAWPESPASAFAVELYSSGIERISRSYVRYHTFGLPIFKDYASASATEQDRLVDELDRLTDEHIATHEADWEEQNYLYLMAGISHETGHGVGIDDLVPPNDGGPWSCFMRYISSDFPKDPNDRMELQARWHHPVLSPQEFCHDPTATVPGKGCYEQIHVTDRKKGGASLHQTPLLPSPGSPASAAATSRWLTMPSPTSAIQVDAASEWDDVLEGDPLRFTVRLTVPSVVRTWTRFLHQQTPPPEPPPFPDFSADWPDGLVMELARVENDGTRTVVVPAGSWSRDRREPPSNPLFWERRTGARTREFLTDPVRVPLKPGEYTLTVAWDGRNRVDPQLLPVSGLVSGGELRWTVASATNDTQRAASFRRLAFQAWDRGLAVEAQKFGHQAIQLVPEDFGREATENIFVVAAANIRLGSLRAAAQLLADFGSEFATRTNPELRLVARDWSKGLAPSIRLVAPSGPAGPTRLEITAHSGQTYTIQVSTDLQNWTALDRRASTTTTYEVSDPDGSAIPGPRFYRVIWEP
ncbi:MAG: hypothetical protein IT581_13020 [Verrucomicrobiales bacterium]|nr:hypothetical protein [Verrucomicrobiales bacterium]